MALREVRVLVYHYAGARCPGAWSRPAESGGEREGGGRFGGAEEWAADDLVERFVGASNEALQTSIARR